MASIRNFKKEVNYVFGDIIDAVLYWEYSNDKPNAAASTALIQEVLTSFDEIIKRISDRKIPNRGLFLKELKKAFEQRAAHFVGRLNELS